MDNQLITIFGGSRAMIPEALAAAGRIANGIAAQNLFENYRERKAANTIRRQKADLALFADFLAVSGLSVGALASDPEAWRGISWGLVQGFVNWQLIQGYAVSSVNIRLSTIKTFVKLALKAGSLDSTEYALIRVVEGYSHREAIRLDEKRQAGQIPTRKGCKKAQPVPVTSEQAQALKRQPNTPPGT